MPMGSGIAVAGVWLAACIAIAFRDSDDWVVPAFFAGLVAWFLTDKILAAGRRDDCDEDEEKNGPGADPARP